MGFINHSTTERMVGVLGGTSFFRSKYSVMSKYLFPVLHCSWNSARRAPIKRMAESSLGKMRVTRSRLRTSSFSRSWFFMFIWFLFFVLDSFFPTRKQEIKELIHPRKEPHASINQSWAWQTSGNGMQPLQAYGLIWGSGRPETGSSPKVAVNFLPETWD